MTKPSTSDDPWAIWHKGGDLSDLVEGTIVPKSFLPSIGFVVVAFSKLDAQLDLTIAYLLGGGQKSRDVGRAIAAAIPNYWPRIELFQRLIDIKVRSTKDRDKLQTIAKAVRSAADKRHRLIHDYMSSITHIEGTLKLNRKEAPFTKNAKPTVIDKASLKELGCRMIDLSYRLQRFTKGDKRWREGAQFPYRDRPRKR